MKFRPLQWCLGMLSLQACATEPLTTFDAYEGAQLPDSELAIIGELHGATAGLDSIAMGGRVVWRKRTTLRDGQTFFGNDVHREQVRLKPGKYQVDFILWCANDGTFLATGNALYVGVQKSADLDLMAGHIYSTNAKNDGYLCHNRFTEGAQLWIEDQTSKRILAGDGAQ